MPKAFKEKGAYEGQKLGKGGPKKGPKIYKMQVIKSQKWILLRKFEKSA